MCVCVCVYVSKNEIKFLGAFRVSTCLIFLKFCHEIVLKFTIKQIQYLQSGNQINSKINIKNIIYGEYRIPRI